MEEKSNNIKESPKVETIKSHPDDSAETKPVKLYVTSSGGHSCD